MHALEPALRRVRVVVLAVAKVVARVVAVVAAVVSIKAIDTWIGGY